MAEEICGRISASQITLVDMGNDKGPGERLILFPWAKG